MPNGDDLALRRSRTGTRALLERDVLLVVDVQNDFLPGGALPVLRGDEVIAPLNRCIDAFQRLGLPIYASRDWHPTDHCSFHHQGGPWPPHCIAGLYGAGPPRGLKLPPCTRLVLKGTHPRTEAYSAFQATGLAVRLRKAGCRRVFIGGLATDYCVRATALDALAAGFETIVLEDAIRAVEVHRGDGKRAIEEMRAGGVRVATVASILATSLPDQDELTDRGITGVSH